MDAKREQIETPSDEFINTATPPRWFSTIASIVFTGLSLIALGWMATHPVFGIGLGHPITITALVLIALAGLWLIVHIWRQSDEEWRKVPNGPLSPEFRDLADRGQTVAAMNRLMAESGAGAWEAWQVIHKYLSLKDQKGA